LQTRKLKKEKMSGEEVGGKLLGRREDCPMAAEGKKRLTKLKAASRISLAALFSDPFIPDHPSNYNHGIS